MNPIILHVNTFSSPLPPRLSLSLYLYEVANRPEVAACPWS